MSERTIVQSSVLEIVSSSIAFIGDSNWKTVLQELFETYGGQTTIPLPIGYKLYFKNIVYESNGEITGGLSIMENAGNYFLITDGHGSVQAENNPPSWASNTRLFGHQVSDLQVGDIVKLTVEEQDPPPQPEDEYLNKTGLQYFWNKLKTYFSSLVTINKIKIGNAELPITDKAVTIPNQVSTITRTQYQMNAYNVNGIHDNTLTISKVSGANRLNISAWDVSLQESVFNYDVPNASEIGDLSLLTTDDKTSLVNALNEVYEKSGEPFRVKNWAGSWADGVTIPVCTKEISNTQIAKMTFSISAEEGADYQIVGMISYEVFDAVSGGNRLNVWPVCQFTGNGQKELSVRWTCMGTQDKLAKRINAWVLLKHR